LSAPALPATVLVPLAKLTPNPDNPRVIRDDKFRKLVQSIRDFPAMLALRPIVVNADGVVLGGNMRLRACKDAGLKEVPVVYADTLTPEQQREFVVKDNVGFGDWDWEALANEWDTTQLDAWGLDVPEVQVEPTTGLTDADDVPEPPKQPITKLGDRIVLGRHTLVCGDSTDVHVVSFLFGGQTADLCFTSPPYALGKSVGLSGNTKMAATGNAYDHHEDSSESWMDLMNGWWAASLGVVTDAWIANVQPLAGNKRQLIKWINDRADRLIDVLTWDKGHAAPQIARGVVASRYEWLIGFGKLGATRAFPLASWQGTVQSVYKGPPQRDNEFSDIHAATMPVHVPMWVIGTLCDKSTAVYDPFSGTGTTLIACENLGRRFFGCEISPAYCDVIVQRWEDFTGQKAIRPTA